MYRFFCDQNLKSGYSLHGQEPLQSIFDKLGTFVTSIEWKGHCRFDSIMTGLLQGPVGPRGPAGVCHIERCVDAVEQRLAAKEQVMELKKSEENEPIAFNVGLASNFTRTHQNHGIVNYDQALLISRHGKPGGYDLRSGIFRAPEAGEQNISVNTTVARRDMSNFGFILYDRFNAQINL